MEQQQQHKNNFHIGQIIYILSNKATKIVPAIVAEELTVKTLSGHKVQWKLFVGPEPKRKIVDLEDVDGEIFSSLEEVNKELVKRFQSFIKKTIQEAEQRKNSWYRDHIKPQAVPSSSSSTNSKSNGSPSNGKINPDDLVEEMEQDQTATEETFSLSEKNITTQEELREKLKKAILSSDNDESETKKEDQVSDSVDSDNKVRTILMPDGTSVPVVL